jgi:hypothetical protein
MIRPADATDPPISQQDIERGLDWSVLVSFFREPPGAMWASGGFRRQVPPDATSQSAKRFESRTERPRVRSRGGSLSAVPLGFPGNAGMSLRVIPRSAST